MSLHDVARCDWEETEGSDDDDEADCEVIDELFGLFFFPDEHDIEDSG